MEMNSDSDGMLSFAEGYLVLGKAFFDMTIFCMQDGGIPGQEGCPTCSADMFTWTAPRVVETMGTVSFHNSLVLGLREISWSISQ